MNINIICHVFIAFSLFIVLCGLLSKYIHAYLPVILTDVMYSKYVTKNKARNMILTNFNVPKR